MRAFFSIEFVKYQARSITYLGNSHTRKIFVLLIIIVSTYDFRRNCCVISTIFKIQNSAKKNICYENSFSIKVVYLQIYSNDEFGVQVTKGLRYRVKQRSCKTLCLCKISDKCVVYLYNCKNYPSKLNEKYHCLK